VTFRWSPGRKSVQEAIGWTSGHHVCWKGVLERLFYRASGDHFFSPMGLLVFGQMIYQQGQERHLTVFLFFEVVK
jgi:hypothetical protein